MAAPRQDRAPRVGPNAVNILRPQLLPFVPRISGTHTARVRAASFQSAVSLVPRLSLWSTAFLHGSVAAKNVTVKRIASAHHAHFVMA